MTNSQAWDYAIGMIKVDGLEPTEDFKRYIEKDWPGMTHKEKTSEFCDSLARLWKIHPFRNGNGTQRRPQKAA